MSRRTLIAGLAVLVLAGALIPLARWEGTRQADAQRHGLVRVIAAVGPLGGSTLNGERPSPTYTCLSYKRGARPFALEICFDRRGHLVEASDRRGVVPQVYSLVLDPDAPTVVVPPSRIRALAERVRRAVVQRAWTAPSRYLELCAGKARVHARDAARTCAAAAPVVAEDAASAGVADSLHVERGALAVSDLLRRYAAALVRGPAAYERIAPELERRAVQIRATLHARVPWLHLVSASR
jgi:hypothetical protein